MIHDLHPYSMPPDAIGIAGTLYLYRDRVRIAAGRFEVTHERKFQPGEGSILPEHRAQHVAAVSGKRAKRYLQREHLLKLGPEALAYLTELTHRRPQVWLRDIDRLHTLLATYGDNAMCAAFARGVAEHAIGAEYIAHFLAEAVTTPRPIEGDRSARRAIIAYRASWSVELGRRTALPRPAVGKCQQRTARSPGPGRRCLIFGGRPGRGKTHLAVAIAYRAIQNGFDALFVTAAELIDELSAAFRRGELAETLARYLHPAVLVVD